MRWYVYPSLPFQGRKGKPLQSHEFMTRRSHLRINRKLLSPKRKLSETPKSDTFFPPQDKLMNGYVRINSNVTTFADPTALTSFEVATYVPRSRTKILSLRDR